MKKNNVAITLTLMALSLASCMSLPGSAPFIETASPLTGAPDQSAESVPIPTPPRQAPEPKPGLASLSGLLYSYTVDRTIPETVYYLTPAVGLEAETMPPIIIGPEEKRGDYVDKSGESGEIQIDDVPPGNYYLIVWAPLNWTYVETEAMDQTPRLFQFEAGDQIIGGRLPVSWP